MMLMNPLPPHVHSAVAAARAGFERTAKRVEAEKAAHIASLAAVAAETVRLLRSGEVKVLRPEPLPVSGPLPSRLLPRPRGVAQATDRTRLAPGQWRAGRSVRAHPGRQQQIDKTKPIPSSQNAVRDARIAQE